MHLNHFFFSLSSPAWPALNSEAPLQRCLCCWWANITGRSSMPFTGGSYFLWLPHDLLAHRSLCNQYQHLQGVVFYLPLCWPTPDFSRSHFHVRAIFHLSDLELFNRFSLRFYILTYTTVNVQKMKILGRLLQSIQYIMSGIKPHNFSPIMAQSNRRGASGIKTCVERDRLLGL